MKRFTSAVRKYVSEQFRDPHAFEKLYIGEKNTCIPEDLLGEDLLLDIKEKFYSIFHPIRERLEKEKLAEKSIYIFVDPSYENITTAIVTYGTEKILYILYEKPWRLRWQTTKEMEEELNEIYAEIKGKLMEEKALRKNGATFRKLGLKARTQNIGNR